jgi:hypothetical protein
MKNKQTILVSLATYVVATAVLLGGAAAFDLIPKDGIDGANGQDGAAGLDGQNGLDGKDAALKVYVQRKSDAASQYTATKVSCKSGDILIGGGAVVNDSQNYMYLVESYPNGNSWVAKATPWDDRSSRGSIVVYAICQDNP